LTERTACWWPLDVETLEVTDRGADVIVEANPGGRVVERHDDGTETTWAELLVWEPPNRVVASWRPPAEDLPATEVEFRVSEERPGLTRVVVEHRGWERLGAEAKSRRAVAETVWTTVIRAFERAATDSEVHRAFASSLQEQVRLALGQPARTSVETTRMIDAAHAARWHAGQVAPASARDCWLVACAYVSAGCSESALTQAAHAVSVAEAGSDAADRTYAADAMARALAGAGRADEAAAWQTRAESALTYVVDADRGRILDDLAVGT
jgi:hypothetical protein